MKLLKNHVVLITGAGSGLGLGVARYCLEQGARIALFEISHEKTEALQAEFGDAALIEQGDVRDIAALQRLKSGIAERFGRLDALIGAQGVFDGNIPLREIEIERVGPLFDELFDINVKGYILTARLFADLLEESRGAIVLTSSTAAYAADGGGLFYSASKGAVRSVVNQLAYEFAPHVRVNAVAPSGIANSQLAGPAALGLQDRKQSDIPADAFAADFRRLSLMPEVPTPEQYGRLYAFLASHQNTIMTGQTVVADQGVLNRSVISQGQQASGIPLD
jgi:NAD(P)-dependent dehydrogenase (short-subunit alcohol dehydrogenase family)